MTIPNEKYFNICKIKHPSCVHISKCYEWLNNLEYFIYKYTLLISNHMFYSRFIYILVSKPTWTRIRRGLVYSWTGRGRHLPAWCRSQCQVGRRRSSSWLRTGHRPPGGSEPAPACCWFWALGELPSCHD